MRHTKSLFLILVFCLAQFNLYSKDLYISIKKNKLKVPEFEYYVEEVSDVREEKFCIGYVINGRSVNNNYVINFQDEFTSEFCYLFERNFEKTTEKKALTVKINHLYLYEEIIENNKSVGVIEFNMDFFALEDNQFIFWFIHN